MKKIIFATGNEGKMKEIRRILADPQLEILSLKDAGIHADIDENGKSFEENAMIKAEAICKMTGEIVLADDSGLEIDYLNKEPGIYSARYMGEDTSYHIKNANLIERLEGVPGEKRPHVLSVPLRRLSRMAEERRFVPPWRGALDTRKKARTVLAMTRSFIFRNMAALPQNFPWKKKTGSAIAEKPFAL